MVITEIVDVLLTLLDKYGVQTAITLVVMAVGVKLILWGMHFTDRLYDTNAQRSQAQNTQEENQSKLTLTLANQADDAHKRLARLQDDMLAAQRRDRETMSRLTDQFTGASLLTEKSYRQTESLVTRLSDIVTRLSDIDERLGLYVRVQQERDDSILQMRGTLNTLLTLLTPKDLIS